MNDQQGWKIVKKYNKKNQNIIIKNDIIENDVIENKQQLNFIHNGDNLLLPYKYILWGHDIYNKDWSLNGYFKFCTISTISEFWKLFNNLDKLGNKSNNFFLMKEGIDPTWEHIDNRNGCTCSFRIDINSSLVIYEDLCARMMCNELIPNGNNINGISLSPKNNWAIIKIWNKIKNNNLLNELNHEILYNYKDLSILYKENDPEF